MQMETPTPLSGIALGALMYPLAAKYAHTNDNFEWITKTIQEKKSGQTILPSAVFGYLLSEYATVVTLSKPSFPSEKKKKS